MKYQFLRPRLLALIIGMLGTAEAVNGAFTWTNGHTYDAIFADNPTWFQARDAAVAMTVGDFPGYLATFTTRAEQEEVITNLGGGAALESLWLGGYQDTADPNYSENYGGWKWITGEPWLGVAPNDPVVPRSDFGFNNTYFDLVHTEEYAVTWWGTGGINDYYHSPSPALGNGVPSRGFIVEFNAIPGDYNGDTKVNAADYVRWRKDPDAFGGIPGGYNTWRANFGNPAPGSGSGPLANGVPAPSTAMLLILAAVGLCPGRRRSAQRVSKLINGRDSQKTTVSRTRANTFQLPGEQANWPVSRNCIYSVKPILLDNRCA